jgi:hypothetical protein
VERSRRLLVRKLADGIGDAPPDGGSIVIVLGGELVCSHSQPTKVRGFSRTASAFTAETDWLLEESGFEPPVPPQNPDHAGTESLRTRRWRKADSNRWSHLRLNGSEAGTRDEQIAMSPLRRLDKQSLERADAVRGRLD